MQLVLQKKRNTKKNLWCVITVFSLELQTAHFARSPPSSLVATPVSLEAGRQSESFTADVVLIRRSRMRFAMQAKTGWLSKTLGALVTFVRLGASVRVDVMGQVFLIRESFPADIALEVFDIAVDSQYVTLQVGFLSGSMTACFTRKRLFSCVYAHVS